MDPLNRKWFYRGFRRRLVTALGRFRADTVWEKGGREYRSMLSGSALMKRHKDAMVLPAAALYRALTVSGADAEDLLNACGARELGDEKAVLCCMQGFQHIRCQRTTAVSEGAECCGYRLRFDPEKK
ncbi:MAG: hypothetical protein IKI84_02530 [Clostridia bacterium]|nr:hypothetical protein [Clostridia bacterium]